MFLSVVLSNQLVVTVPSEQKNFKVLENVSKHATASSGRLGIELQGEHYINHRDEPVEAQCFHPASILECQIAEKCIRF